MRKGARTHTVGPGTRVPPVAHKRAEIAVGQPALRVERAEHIRHARKWVLQNQALHPGISGGLARGGGDTWRTIVLAGGEQTERGSCTKGMAVYSQVASGEMRGGKCECGGVVGDEAGLGGTCCCGRPI